MLEEERYLPKNWELFLFLRKELFNSVTGDLKLKALDFIFLDRIIADHDW